MKRIAFALLVAAGALLAATYLIPYDGFWTGLLRAAAEAALVGGLADWFAVTALFRRPLGLPIPHTAIIPRNKDRLGQGLGTFVSENFLRPDLVAARLTRLDLARHGADWLAMPANAQRAAGVAAAAIPAVLRALEDKALRQFAFRIMRERSAGFDVAPLLRGAVALLEESGALSRAFAEGLGTLKRTILSERDRLLQAVTERSAWWVPRTIDRRLAEAIIQGALELVDELADSANPRRRSFDAALRARLESEDFLRALASFRDQILNNEAARGAFESLWRGARDGVLEDFARPDSAGRQIIADSLASLGRLLQTDPAGRETINQRIEYMAVRWVGPWRTEIGAFITDVVRSWNADTIAERLEQAVGRDLQYVRINGSIVGALVGCLLFLLERLL